MAAQCIEHLQHRLGEVRFEGMVFNLAARRGELPHRRVRGGRGGVAAAGGDGILHVDHALFRNADHAAGLRYAGEHVIHDRAALVQHQFRLDVMGLKVIHDVDRALAVDFLAAGEGEVDVVFRHKALGDQVLRRGEHAVERHLRVQRAASPHHAVADFRFKCRVRPVFLFHRHHVVVRHQHRGFAVALALPAEEQAAVLHALHRAGLGYVWEELRQLADQLFKLRIVLQRVIFVGDRAALHQLCQRVKYRVLVVGDGLCRRPALRLGRKGRRADQNHGKKDEHQRQDDPTDHE